MQKYADYIEQIEIDSLWSGRRHIIWDLDKHVNILSGTNGQGKSTIINKVVKGLSAGGEYPSHMLKGVRLKVHPSEARWIRYDVIRSFDRPLMNLDTLTKMDMSLATELDWQIFQRLSGKHRQPHHRGVAKRRTRCCRESPSPVGSQETVPGPYRRTFFRYGQDYREECQ